jgi:menaquinone-dependent protoporphyrinogen oxidase
MKNIILFASRHGNTERILTELVNRASASASGELLLKPVRKTPRKDLEDADRIAVGGPVYMGKMRGEVAAFLSRNRALLLSKPLALFAGCHARGDEARAQLERVFPADLRAHAAVTTSIGGDVDLDKLPFLMRGIMKNIAKTEEDKHSPEAGGRETLYRFLVGGS